MDPKAFDNFALNDNKYQLEIENYLVPTKETLKQENDQESTQTDEYLVYNESSSLPKEPHIATWDYLTKTEVQMLLKLKKKRHVRQFIEYKLNKKNPKGVPRIIFRELMYTVTQFCKSSNFSLEQAGAVLSQFYLTHLFFTSSLTIGAEKLYDYFKELQLCHSLPFPPQSIKLFNLEEIKSIMIYFCKLYLRNLPIIRFVSLPNFTLRTNYHLDPEIIFGGKKKKGKKKKKKKKKKKNKKGKGKKKKK